MAETIMAPVAGTVLRGPDRVAVCPPSTAHPQEPREYGWIRIGDDLLGVVRSVVYRRRKDGSLEIRIGLLGGWEFVRKFDPEEWEYGG